MIYKTELSLTHGLTYMTFYNLIKKGSTRAKYSARSLLIPVGLRRETEQRENKENGEKILCTKEKNREKGPPRPFPYLLFPRILPFLSPVRRSLENLFKGYSQDKS